MRRKIMAWLMTFVMVFTSMPIDVFAASVVPAGEDIYTISDPETLTRPADVYGQNTLNAGKVTVGKSVSDDAVTIPYGNTSETFTPDEDNFIVVSSQTAQVMGLASESDVPLDVVFVLDTSGSMNQNGVNRASSMVTAANSAIATLMAANENNRIAVVTFSSADSEDEEYGGGTSNGAAANVLSSLAHYTGDAATNHLTWVNSSGSATGGGTKDFIAGRDVTTVRRWQNGRWQNVTVNAYRNGSNGGTNIQAGIIEGAKLLTAENNTTTVTDEQGNVITRMPFLVILSDGEPTFSLSDSTWYNPTSDGEQGPGNGSYAGNGFLPVLTAAYYKSLITEKYYGTKASEDNRCNIYTIGVQLGDDLAELTMNPKDHFVAGSNNYYYNSFNSYWNSYNRGNGFTIQVNGNGNNANYTISAASITATKDRISGESSTGAVMYAGGLQYNDEYFAASSTAEIAEAFQGVVTSIQKKAVSSPTHVDATYGHDFSGYVTYTDILGEYMEVKDMKGVLANGHFYQGASFARILSGQGTAEETAALKASLIDVLETRMSISQSTAIDLDAFLTAAANSPNQLRYTNGSNFDNSIVWWGKSFNVEGEEEDHVQVLVHADNDTIEYITDPSTQIPEGADYVCRSYFFYGTAGGTVENPNHDYLYFVVRVQRSLSAPYQQTVVVSAPASLLAVEEVFVVESEGNNGDPVYTVSVEPAEPARVVYEVGLRSDINAYNIESIMAEDAAYLNETAKFNNQDVYTNYDAASGEYTFYTNDWDRTKDEESHERAMTTVTFDAAADNAFYTYQEDTLIVDSAGNPYTGDTAPVGTYYYAREYYDWANAAMNDDGTYNAEKKIEYIKIDIPANAGEAIIQKDGRWYIAEGVYAASTLTGGEDVDKSSNDTQTSEVVAHPERTGSYTNSHYTVHLGNNGKLVVKAKDTKTVSDSNGNNVDGQAVIVGQELTYTILVVNDEDFAGRAVVTDVIPVGTELVANSITEPGVYDEATKTIRWAFEIDANTTKKVSFKVKVTEDALLQAVPGISNTANVKIGDNEYDTNITYNPPIGKVVEGAGTTTDPSYDGEVTVGTELTYYIEYANDTAIEQTITIVDNLPTGTNYISGSASHGGEHAVAANGDEILTWTLTGVDPGESGVVSFRVVVDASAVTPVENSATIKIGDHEYTTNVTDLDVPLGNLSLKKVVVKADDAYEVKADEEFTLVLTEIGSGIADVGTLNGTYKVQRNGEEAGNVEFVNGVATIKVKHNDTVVIQGLPAGTELEITENAVAGYTASFAKIAVTRSVANVPAPLADAFRVEIEKDATVAVQVTNTYSPAPAYFQLSGTKTLSTDIEDFPLTTFTFRAQAYDIENNKIIEGDEAITVTAQASVSGTKKVVDFTFSGRSFSKPEVRHYLITEDAGSQGGMTYSGTQYLLTITISDDGSGQLTADWTLQSREGDSGDFSAIIPDTKTVSFTNSYVPQKTELVLSGSKTLSKRTLQDKEFSFVVQENGQTVAVGENDADENIVFSAIPYDKEGTHTYTISEVQAGGNVGYDQSVYTITVSVEANHTTGKLEAKVTGIQKDGEAITEGVGNGYVYAFHNEYDPGNAEVILEAKKVLEDAENTGRTLRAGEFAFNVYAVEKNQSGEWIRTSATAVATGTNDVNGNVIFSNLEYSYEDIPSGQTTAEFYYEIEEVIPVLTAEPNMDYDETSRYVKVTLSYDTVKGILSAVVDYNAETPEVDNAASSFINIVYSPSIQVVPAGTKVTHSAPEADITFGFVVINTATGNEAGAGTVVGSDTAQNITFSPLTYTEPGVYTYWIMESNAGNTTNGITYDKTRYLMQVTITRVNGQLQEAVKYYASAGVDGSTNVSDYTVEAVPAFENTYAAEGYLTLTATKVLTGRALKANEFAFSLVRNGGGEITGVADAGGNINMTLYYTHADIPQGQSETKITYTMSEIIPVVSPIPGVTYDTTRHTIEVAVKDGGEGKISAYVSAVDGVPVTAGNGETGIVFNNTYKVVEDAEVTIEATKTLTGRGMREGEFFFDLYRKDGNNDIFVASAQNVNTDSQNGTVTFVRHYPAATIWEQLRLLDQVSVDPETGRNVGTIIYVLKERNDGMGGVTYDSTEHTIIVTITDNGDGTMSTTVDYNGAEEGLGTAPVFENSYSAGEITYTPVGSKNLLGADEEEMAIAEGQFTFEVVKLNADKTEEEGVVALGWSRTDGSIRFDPIRYVDNISGTVTNSVTNYYVIREVNRGASGITYSTEKYYLKVTVTDEGAGSLKTEAQYYSDAAFTQEIEDNKVVFTNHYGSGEVNFNLALKKNFETSTGKAYNYVLHGSEFDFEVYEWNPTTSAKGAEVTVGTNGKSDANGVASITFGTIIYTREDVYGVGKVSTTPASKDFYYVIEEIEPRNADERGIKIDTTPVYVKVTVSDDGYGNLSTSVAYVDQNGTENGVDTFTNIYDPNGVELTIIADKNLSGKNWTDEKFSFILSGGHLTEAQTIVVDNTNGGLFNHTLEFVTADMSGAREISNGVFEKTFEYTLTESTTMPTNEYGTYTRDAAVYKIVVTLSDNGSGQLMANAKYYKDNTEVTAMEFVNQYTPEALEIDLTEQINASKTINGRDFKENETFTFEVYDVTGKVVSEGTSQTPENGVAAIKFDSFTFNQAGEYHYRIREASVSGNGITVDERLWRLSIVVTYDADTGKLKIEDTDLQTYEITETGAIEAKPAFVNVYDPAPTSVTITANKTLSGRDLKDREFAFYLMEGNLIAAEGYNDVNGNITFKVNYTKVGTHTYSIVEVVPSEKLGGVTYDEVVRENVITIEVKDNGEGQLVAYLGNSPLTNGQTVGSGVTIQNKYEAQPVKAYIEAHKILTGGKDLEANKYTFELWQNGDVVETAENAADGSVSFELLYSTEGVYTYTMKEKAGNEPGVTYDGASYDVTVTVVDDEKGQLHAQVTYGTIDGLKPSFINTYDSGEATVEFNATKVLVGSELQGDEFTFELHQTDETFAVSEATLFARQKNGAAGAITFTKLFETPGTYYFVMLEVNDGSQENVVYDGTQYKYKVVVGNTIEVTCLNGELNNIVFTNTPFEEVTEKTVFKNGDLTVNIDGQKVEVGDKLTYKIEYTNYTGVATDVTITDTIPQYTTYVAGSAGNSGVYANGELTWTFEDVAPGATITVSFDVTVEMGKKILTNEAEIVDGQNTYKTNEVVNHTIDEKLVKDVFNKAEPTISIDGEKVNVGDTLIYTVTYINPTADEVTVKINDVIPEHTTYVANSADNGGTYNNGTLIWENLKVAPWGSVTVTFQVTVDDPEVIFTNVGTAIDASGKITSNEVVNHTVVEIVDKDVALKTEPTISIDGKKVEVGDVLTYTITYINVTGKTADVKITDMIPEHTTYVAGSANYGGVLKDGELIWNLVVAPWVTAEVTFQVTVNDQDAFIKNQAEVYDGKNNYDTDEVVNHTFEEEGEKDVFDAKKPNVSIDGQVVEVGTELLYTISYANTTDKAVDVEIIDAIPAHTTFVSADNNGAHAEGKVTWNLTVAANAEVTVSFKVKVAEAGVTVKNQAEIWVGNNGYVTNVVENTVPGKTVDKEVAAAGDTLTYTITYTNVTGAKADVEIIDTLDKNLTYVEDSSKATYKNGVLSWSFEDVEDGETITVSFKAKVNMDTDAEEITNVATIVENNVEVKTNGTTTELKAPELDVYKVQQYGERPFTQDKLYVKTGTNVTYGIVVKNIGDVNAYGITVTDKIPEGLVPVAKAVSHDGTIKNGVVTWTIDTLAPGESVVLTFAVAVPKAEEKTRWINIATVVYENNEEGPDKEIETNKVVIEVDSAPQTGDEQNVGKFAGVAAIALIGMSAAIVASKKRKKEEAAE